VSAALADPRVRIAVTYFIAAQLLDSLTTLMGLVFGLGEANPVTTAVMRDFGGFGLLMQKVPVVLVVVLGASLPWRRTATAATWAFTTVVGAVVASNVALVLASPR